MTTLICKKKKKTFLCFNTNEIQVPQKAQIHSLCAPIESGSRDMFNTSVIRSIRICTSTALLKKKKQYKCADGTNLCSFFSSFTFKVLQAMSEKVEEKTTVEATSKSEVQEHEYEDQYGPEPTEEDYKTLREVSGSLPISAYLVLIIEFCERFTYYGLTGPFQNYIQFPAPPSCKFDCLIIN